MIIKLYKRGEGDIPEFIKEFELKGSPDDKGSMSLIGANIQQVASEILGEHVESTGFTQFRSCGDFWSNFMVRDGVAKDLKNSSGWSESIISGGADNLQGDLSIEWIGKTVTTKSGVTDLQIGVNAYDTGYIINSSAKLTNILGGSIPAFFSKITSKNFKQGSRRDAKLFKDEKALLKYLKDKEDIFSFIHSKTDAIFGFEKKSSLWEHEPKDSVIDEIGEVLERINSSADSAPETKVFGEDMHDEAHIRMKEMDLYKPVRIDFLRSDKLYMSEFGGIIYDLNDEAEEAVRRTSEYGLPYHVIRTQHECGDMYAVLFVSKEKEEWEYERLDQKTGIMYANVYNASMGIDEMGTIGVKPANGGLVRTA